MKILFMCTANSCRSVLSEGLFNQMAPAGFTAISSGSFPSGKLNPRAVSTLQGLGIDTSGLYSKGSEVFADTPPISSSPYVTRLAVNLARCILAQPLRATGDYLTPPM